MSRIRFKATGTSWDIDIPDINEDKLAVLSVKIQDRLLAYEKTYSRFRENSLVTQISKSAGEYIFPEDAEPMMALYKKLYDLTGGKMTPLIGQVLVDAGYDSSYSLRAKDKIEKAPKWEDSIEYNHPKLTAKKPIQLDFGAIGKGYAIDIVAKLIESEGIFSCMINAGGDLVYKNPEKKKIRVGLEDPRDKTKVVGVAEIYGGSICGSAGNRRVWSTHSHIIDPDSTMSPIDIMALWVTAENTMTADALTTALFFTSPEILKKEFSFEWAIIRSDGSLLRSKDFPGSFF